MFVFDALLTGLKLLYLAFKKFFQKVKISLSVKKERKISHTAAPSLGFETPRGKDKLNEVLACVRNGRCPRAARRRHN